MARVASEADFGAVVGRLERYATAKPNAYRLRVLGMVAVGYGFIGLLMAAVPLLVVAGVVIIRYWHSSALAVVKLVMIPALVGGYSLARAVWVRAPRPMGIEVSRADAPELFATLDSIRARLQGPSIAHVLVVDDFNCAVVQHGRLGVFGWMENYLIIGLPFAMALGVDDLRSVLAHEYGHLSGRHGHFGSWVYRLRRTWSTLQASAAQGASLGSRVLRRFADWYAPHFNAYTFVLARRNEYQADQLSASVVGAHDAGRALVRSEACGYELARDFWPRFRRGARDAATPPQLPYSMMRAYLMQPSSAASAETTMATIMGQVTGYADTHPSTADRLAALGVEPSLAPPPGTSAAELLFGALLPRLIEEFDRSWADDGGLLWWERRHRALAAMAERSKALDDAAAARPLDAGEAYERAWMAAELEPDADPKPLFEAALRYPEPVPGAVIAGAIIRLQANDASGVQLAEEAFGRKREAVADLAPAVFAYAERSGRGDLIDAWRDRYRTYVNRERARENDLARLKSTDFVKACTLDASRIDVFAAACAASTAIARAWLVEKILVDPDERRSIVLAVKPRWLRRVDKDAVRARVAAAFDDTHDMLAVVVMDSKWKPLLKRIQKIDGAQIVPAPLQNTTPKGHLWARKP